MPPTRLSATIGLSELNQLVVTSSLFDLPSELLLEVLHYLLPPAQLSLQHVCHWLYERTPSMSAPAAIQNSPCERNALFRANEENALLRSGKRRCIVCRQLALFSRFRWDKTPICKWHDGWFFKRGIPDALEPELQRRLRALLSDLDCWVSFPRWYCAHSKDVINWDVGDCRCGCEICGHFDVTCFVRISAMDGTGRELELVGSHGRMEMSERRRQDGPYGHPSERRLPVLALRDL